MTPRKVGGYATRQAINQAMNANLEIGESLNRLVTENPPPHRAAVLLARASTALIRNSAALNELTRIVSTEPSPP
jgi:thioredoxin-like negative regulator of GroEL